MGGCCYGCLKYMVMIFNLVYMLLGGALLGISLWMYLDGINIPTVPEDVDDQYNSVLFFLMAIGAVMFIMGFLGCCGALQESQCMLSTFFALVLVLVAAQLAAAVFFTTNEERFIRMFKTSLMDSIRNDYGYNDLKTRAFDGIQRELQCCGVEGPRDWRDSRFMNSDEIFELAISGSAIGGTYKVPESCCSTEDQNHCNVARLLPLVDISQLLHPADIIPSDIFTEGCANKAIKYTRSHDMIMLIVASGIVLVEFLAMCFSMILCCAVRRIDQFKA